VVEDGARAVPPQRVGAVGDRLRRRHRHLHRLVAGLRHRVLDLRQGRGLADAPQAIDGRTAAHGGADGGDRETTQNEGNFRHDTHSLRGASPDVSVWVTIGADTRVVAATVTWPGPDTVPCTVRLDWTLRTLTVSPTAPESRALPRMVRTRPGAS